MLSVYEAISGESERKNNIFISLLWKQLARHFKFTPAKFSQTIYNVTMFDFIKSIYWEIMSYFVPEKLSYEITGKCKKCGKCCNYMYSFDTYTEKEFKIMQFLFPAYKRFYIKGKDEDGNFIFACKYVTKEGLCSVYDKRLAMCKRYPAPRIFYPAQMHEGCGFTVQKIYFRDYLKKKQ